MAGIAARPFPALFTQTKTTTSYKHPSFCIFSSLSAFLGKKCGRNCWTGSRTRGASQLHARGLAIAAFGGFPSSSGGRRRQRMRRPPPQEVDPALDLDRIKTSSVRLIDEEQNMVGIVSTSKSIQMARDAGLDLVIISPDADPPVVRIIDYSKYKYEQQKRKKEQQKKNAANRVDLKELKMGYNIDTHDYAVRLRAAQRFLKDGNKVKVVVQLKGRENDFKANAMQLFERFQNEIGELATVESKDFADKNMFIVLAPKKAAQKGQSDTRNTDKSQEKQVAEVSAGV